MGVVNPPQRLRTVKLPEPADFRKGFALRLNELLDRRNVPRKSYGRISHVANALGVSVPTAGRWLSGSVMPDLPNLRTICTWLQCSYDELLGHPASELPFKSDLAPVESNDGNLWRCILGGLARELLPYSSDVPKIKSGSVYVAKVVSAAMAPFVNEGDYIVFEPVTNFTLDGVYVLSKLGTTLIRRVESHANGTFRLIADNSTHQGELVEKLRFWTDNRSTQSDPVILGRVIVRTLVAT